MLGSAVAVAVAVALESISVAAYPPIPPIHIYPGPPTTHTERHPSESIAYLSVNPQLYISSASPLPTRSERYTFPLSFNRAHLSVLGIATDFNPYRLYDDLICGRRLPNLIDPGASDHHSHCLPATHGLVGKPWRAHRSHPPRGPGDRAEEP